MNNQNNKYQNDQNQTERYTPKKVTTNYLP